MVYRVRMKMQLENAWYVCILYIWYSIRVWFDKKTKTPGEVFSKWSQMYLVYPGTKNTTKWFEKRLQDKYFQNCQIFLDFLGGKEVIWNSVKTISIFRFWVKSFFFQIRVYIYRKGQQNCNFRFPTPWSRCIILAHSSLVLRYSL